MKSTVTFLHLEHTPALDQKIAEKNLKLERYLGRITPENAYHVHWYCTAHIAEIKIHGHQIDHFVKVESDSLYKSIDMATEKMMKILEKQKERWKEHIHHKHDLPLKKRAS